MKYTITQLNDLSAALHDAGQAAKSYTISDPKAMSEVIDEYIKVRQERDTYVMEHAKLISVLEEMYNMAEAVNGMAVKIKTIIED